MPSRKNILYFLYAFVFIWYFNGVNDLLSYFIFSKEESRVLTGIGMAMILTVPCLFLNRYLKIYLLLIYLLSVVPSLIFFVHFLLFKCPILHENYFVIYETFTREVMEFASQNLSFKIIFLTLVYMLSPFILFAKIKPITSTSKEKIMTVSFSVLYSAAVFCFPLASQLSLLSYNNYYVDIVSSYSYYQHEKSELKKISELRKKNSEHTAVAADTSLNASPTYLVIIGESTGKYHMSLYGYGRKTNPILSAFGNNIYPFDKVFSSDAHTIPSLEKMLTFSTRKDTTPYYLSESLISLFNKAGFNTYWISGQNRLGLNETGVSILASEAKNIYFEKDSLSSMSNRYDESLLPKIREVLTKDKAKKIMFIHLMGTHQDYKFRYPGEYDVFKDKPKMCFSEIDQEQTDIINSYDNAVLYNDHVVSSILNLSEQYAGYSCAIYLSDHGDEVYEERDFLGHADENVSKYMLDIPFVLWMSDEFKDANKEYVKCLPEYLNRNYCSEDLIHTVLDIAKIRTQKYDETRSIFSPNFIARDEYRNW